MMAKQEVHRQAGSQAVRQSASQPGLASLALLRGLLRQKADSTSTIARCTARQAARQLGSCSQAAMQPGSQAARQPASLPACQTARQPASLPVCQPASLPACQPDSQPDSQLARCSPCIQPPSQGGLDTCDGHLLDMQVSALWPKFGGGASAISLGKVGQSNRQAGSQAASQPGRRQVPRQVGRSHAAGQLAGYLLDKSGRRVGTQFTGRRAGRWA